MQSAGCVVAGLDDLGEGAVELDAHFAVDDAVVRAPRSGRLFAGPRYVIIPEELKEHRPAAGAGDEPRPVLCVGFGGSDMRGLTLPAARALAAWDAVFEAHIVLGPCVADPGAVEDFCAYDSRFTVHRDPLDLFQLMAEASLAVCSVGQGMFELACLGVPTLVVSLSELHERMAGNFAAYGCSEHLGPHHAFSGDDLVARCRGILGDAARWRAMRQAALRTVDGGGARRICDLIWELTGNC
jgi:spore coat polysaccharide biosynthesis predicted glycosyltransferase SpsG